VGNPLAVPALDALFVPCALVALAGLVVGAGSLLGRFRRARGTERLQLRWLALAAAVSAAALLLALATGALGGPVTLFQAAFGVSVGVLPLATGAAILRYRLYDLDRIVSRTWPRAPDGAPGGGYAWLCSGWASCLADSARGGRRDPGRGRGVPAGPTSRPAGGRPAVQPPPPRRRPDHRGAPTRLRDQPI
jgi:hypothetical protein